jgi:hypothetical protein
MSPSRADAVASACLSSIGFVAAIVSLTGCVASGGTEACQPEKVRPITVERMADALRAQGFDVGIARRSYYCAGDGLGSVALVTNDRAEGVGVPASAVNDEGTLDCVLTDNSDDGPSHVLVDRTPKHTSVWLLNVQCLLTPPERAREQRIIELRRAVQSLRPR